MNLSKTVGALLLTLTAASASAAPIKVAVLGGTSNMGTWSSAAAQLNDDSFFDFSATLLSGAAVTTAADLQGYDVVLMGGSGNSTIEYNGATLAAVADFMKAGHGVVSTSWSRFGAISQSGSVKANADLINPVQLDNSYTYGSGTTFVVTDASHAITKGVSNIAIGGCCGETGLLDSGAIGLATIDGRTALAYQDLVGRSVYLGLMYTGGLAYDFTGLRNGNGDRLLEQAVAWSANTDSDVPEPASIALFGAGLAGLLARRRRAG